MRPRPRLSVLEAPLPKGHGLSGPCLATGTLRQLVRASVSIGLRRGGVEAGPEQRTAVRGRGRGVPVKWNGKAEKDQAGDHIKGRWREKEAESKTGRGWVARCTQLVAASVHGLGLKSKSWSQAECRPPCGGGHPGVGGFHNARQRQCTVTPTDRVRSASRPCGLGVYSVLIKS